MNPMAWVGNTDYSKAKRDEVLRKSQEFLGGAVWPKAKTNTAEKQKREIEIGKMLCVKVSDQA